MHQSKWVKTLDLTCHPLFALPPPNTCWTASEHLNRAVSEHERIKPTCSDHCRPSIPQPTRTLRLHAQQVKTFHQAKLLRVVLCLVHPQNRLSIPSVLTDAAGSSTVVVAKGFHVLACQRRLALRSSSSEQSNRSRCPRCHALRTAKSKRHGEQEQPSEADRR